MRIVIAMSGGVDSSVAAALLVEAGHEVIGVSMRTHRLPAKSNRACCTPDDMRDARAVASKLGIPFYLLAYEDLFEREVIEPFVQAYQRGETPNPCVACNDRVKFAPLLQQARLLGADKLATGHYARLQLDSDGEPTLRRARDGNKDQSYFLYRLQPAQLAHLLFPLGDLEKEEVRAHARRLGLGERVAAKPESQEICFVGAGGYAAVVESRRCGPVLQARNEFIDEAGRVLGTHAGVHHFTIGQRRKVGIAAAEALYVIDIDAAAGTVMLGPRSRLLRESLTLTELSFTGRPPAYGEALQVQVRHRGQRVAAALEPMEPTSNDGFASPGAAPTRCRLRFARASERPAPGQAAVLYRPQGDGSLQVLGGGIVAASRVARLPVVGALA